MIKLKNILFEVAPEIAAKYGDVLFGDITSLAHLQKKNKEPNTELENKLFDILMSWYDGYSGDFDSAANILHKYKTELFNLKKEYPEILNPPATGTPMYRGLSYQSNTLQFIIDSVDDHKLKPDGYFKSNKYSNYRINNGLVFKNIKYNPMRSVTSWSTKMYNKMRSIYLISKIDKNCIMNPKSSYSFYPEINQYEVIHFDNFDYKIDAVVASDNFDVEITKNARENLKLYTTI